MEKSARYRLDRPGNQPNGLFRTPTICTRLTGCSPGTVNSSYNLFFCLPGLPSTKASMGIAGRISGWLVHRADSELSAADYRTRLSGRTATFWALYQAGGGAKRGGQSDGRQQRLFLLRERHQHVRSGYRWLVSRHNHPVPSKNFPDMGHGIFLAQACSRTRRRVYNCFPELDSGYRRKWRRWRQGILRGPDVLERGPRRAERPDDHGACPFAIRRQLHKRPSNQSDLGRSPTTSLGDTADWGALGSITGELITGAVQGERSANDTARPTTQLLTPFQREGKIARLQKRGEGPQRPFPLFHFSWAKVMVVHLRCTPRRMPVRFETAKQKLQPKLGKPSCESCARIRGARVNMMA